MKREDIEKLLGGYATGTLTPEERARIGTHLEHSSPNAEDVAKALAAK